MSEPYTYADFRSEAARQLRAAVDPESLDVLTNMEGSKIPSRGDAQWDELNDDDLHDAALEISDLVENAVDLTRWSVDLGSCFLTRTTNLAWGHGNAWDVAVQIAHRPGMKEDLHEQITSAVSAAVAQVLADRDLSLEQCNTGAS